jgi:hypothetical protein
MGVAFWTKRAINQLNKLLLIFFQFMWSYHFSRGEFLGKTAYSVSGWFCKPESDITKHKPKVI